MTRSLLAAATPLLVGRAISGLIGIAIPIYLARQLAPHAYGTYKQFFLVASTCFLVGQVGLPASLYYFVPRSGAARARFVVQALSVLLAAGAVAAIVVALVAPGLAARFDNPELASLTAPLATYVGLSIAAAPLEIALTSSQRTGWAAVAYVISDGARAAALTAPLAAGLGLDGIAWAAVGVTALRFGAAWTLALAGAVGPPAVPTRGDLRAQLRYAVPFAGAVLLGVVQMHFPQYAVAALTDASTFAVFAVGATQIPFTEVFYSPIAEVMMVRIGQVEPSGVPAVFREAVARLAMFFLPLAAFVWGVAPVLIPTLFTAQYAAALPIFCIAVGEILLSTLPVDGLCRALGATRAIFAVNAARLAVTSALVPLGLVLFGLPGAMGGFVLAQVGAKTALLALAARRLGAPLASLFPGRVLAAWTVRSVAIFGAATVLRVVGPWRGAAYLAAASIVGLAAWGVSLLVAPELRKEVPLG